MDSNDRDEFGLNYEKYYGKSSIFSARFALGIFTEFIGEWCIDLFTSEFATHLS